MKEDIKTEAKQQLDQAWLGFSAIWR